MNEDEATKAAKAWEMNHMKQKTRKRELTGEDIVPYYVGALFSAFIGFGVYLDPILAFSMVLLVLGFILLLGLPCVIAWTINKAQKRQNAYFGDEGDYDGGSRP